MTNRVKQLNFRTYTHFERTWIAVKAWFKIRQPLIEVALHGLNKVEGIFGTNKLEDRYMERLEKHMDTAYAYSLLSNGYGSFQLRSLLCKIIYERGAVSDALGLLKKWDHERGSSVYLIKKVCEKGNKQDIGKLLEIRDKLILSNYEKMLINDRLKDGKKADTVIEGGAGYGAITAVAK